MRSLLNVIWVIAVLAAVAGCSKKNPPANPAEQTAPETAAVEEQPQSVPIGKVEVSPEAAAKIEELKNAGPVTYAESGIGMKAPALEGLTWIKGDAVELKADKVYVVEFWATWCPPCRASIPHLTEIQKHFGDKVTIIGISSEDQEKVRPFVENMADQMAYTVAVDAEGKAVQNYSKAFGQGGIPHAFVIDQNQQIAWVGHPMAGLDQVLEQVLKGEFDPVAFAKEKAEREALQKQLQEWYGQYFTAILTEGISEKTTEYANSFIEKAPAEMLNAFAWNILTQAPEGKRQADIALKAAEKANEMTENKNPMVMDTYALALFENGKVAEAIALQEKTIELCASNPEMQAELTQTLERYKGATQAN